jgi:hypothetical protein
MEQAIDKLTVLDKKMLAMNILEEYTRDEVARLLSYNPRTVRRLLQSALDELSKILLAGGLLDKLACDTGSEERCQGARIDNFHVSGTNEGGNKYRKIVRTPPAI